MTRIVIIGGGIGGLAAAGCLRARGVEASVWERTSELREVGAALALWPNATRIVKQLGVLDDLVSRSHLAPVGALRDWRGKILKKMVAIDAGVPTVFSHRADVHRALLSALPDDVLHLNKTCTSVQREGSHIRGVFSDGTFTEWADGLVGADGIRSVMREMSLKDGIPTYRGYVAWRGVAVFDSGDEMVGETWGKGQRFGFIPLGRGRVGWWATANKPGKEGTDTCAKLRGEWKAELSERFKGWHSPIEKLLEMTAEGEILCNAIMDREPAVSWGNGPMTLLGDAAHPMTPNLGQGACSAIEDAAVLAHAVAACPSVEAAFRVYEKTRQERTAMIVRESLKFGKMGQWKNPVACALRNVLLQFAPDASLRKQFRDLWMYDAWNAVLKMPAA